MSLKADKLTDLISKSRQLLPGLVHPSVYITEVPGDKKDTTAEFYRYLGNYFIDLSFQPFVYPVLVHEYGHIALRASLIRDLPEMARDYEIADKIDDAQNRLDHAANRLARRLSSKERQRAEHDQWEAQNDLNKWGPLKFTEWRNVTAVSLYFEEIFADLLSSAIYRKQTEFLAWADGVNGESGYRNLGVLEKNRALKPAFCDPHYELQEFAAFIYLNYLAKPNANPTLIFNKLYEVIKEQLQDGIKTGWIYRTMDPEEDPQTGHTLLGGRDTNRWNQDLKKIFKAKMRKAGVS